MKKILLTFLVFGSSQLMAQQLNNKNAIDANRSNVEVTYFGFGIPKTDDLELTPEFNHVISKNKSENEDVLDEIKRQKMILKKKDLLANPVSEVENKKTRGGGPTTPIVVVGYDALSNQGTPPDNTIAVNKSNQLVAIVNSSIRYYNASNGVALASSKSLGSFFTTLSNTTLATTDICDPKVIFDAHSDRFIVFAQTCEGDFNTSQVLLAFSKTANPTDGWNFYGWSGNQEAAVGQNGWFDYPKLAVSNHDVFVTGNIFTNGGQFIESVIFQIDKLKCYAGSTLVSGDASIYSGIANSPFTMVPMSNGMPGGYGDNMYLVATGSSASGTSLKIYEISGAVQTNPTITSQVLGISDATSPANGIQKGSSIELMTGSNRGLDGFYLNGKIHFVFHGDVSPSGTGYSSVVYKRLKKNGATWIIDKEQNITAAGKDYTYPSIAAMGYHANDQAAIIQFNYSSTTEFPGMKAVYIDEDGVKSTAAEVKTGTGYVDLLASGGETRWGDYTGLSRVQNASVPTAWCFASYGNTSHAWTNHFAKITTANFPAGANDILEVKQEAMVYPNPIIDDYFQLKLNLKEHGKLEINLLDINGRMIREIYSTNAMKGENHFSFNKGSLANGNYIVSIKLNSVSIQNEKITVSHK